MNESTTDISANKPKQLVALYVLTVVTLLLVVGISVFITVYFSSQSAEQAAIINSNILLVKEEINNSNQLWLAKHEQPSQSNQNAESDIQSSDFMKMTDILAGLYLTTKPQSKIDEDGYYQSLTLSENNYFELHRTLVGSDNSSLHSGRWKIAENNEIVLFPSCEKSFCGDTTEFTMTFGFEKNNNGISLEYKQGDDFWQDSFLKKLTFE